MIVTYGICIDKVAELAVGGSASNWNTASSFISCLVNSTSLPLGTKFYDFDMISANFFVINVLEK